MTRGEEQISSKVSAAAQVGALLRSIVEGLARTGAGGDARGELRAGLARLGWDMDANRSAAPRPPPVDAVEAWLESLC